MLAPDKASDSNRPVVMQLSLADPASLERVCAIDRNAGSHPWPRTALIRAQAASDLYLATERGELVGFLVSQSVLDETTLMHLAVSYPFQRRGWGRAMLEHWIQQQRHAGQSRLLLEVRVSNRVAISLYESLGFTRIGLRRGYYGMSDGSEDALVMAREVSKNADLAET